MKVGTICKLKVTCMNNKAGTLGVVFNEYSNGFQAIFENGSYDGFSIINSEAIHITFQGGTEAAYFLEEVGFEESLAGYQFKNVSQVSTDYRNGLFNIAWSEQGTTADILRKHTFGTEKLAEYLDQNYPKENKVCFLKKVDDILEMSNQTVREQAERVLSSLDLEKEFPTIESFMAMAFEDAALAYRLMEKQKEQRESEESNGI